MQVLRELDREPEHAGLVVQPLAQQVLELAPLGPRPQHEIGVVRGRAVFEAQHARGTGRGGERPTGLTRLQHGDLGAGERQPPRRAESVDPGPDHDDARSAHGEHDAP